MLVLGGRGGDEALTPTDSNDSAFRVDADGATLEFERSDDEATVEFEGTEDGRFRFDLDGDGAITEGDGGTFELSGSTPPGWPSDFPPPPGGTVVRGSMVDAGALTQRSVTYRTSIAAEEVLDHYEASLAGAAPVVTRRPGPPGTADISFEGLFTGYLSVGVADGATVVAVALYEEG
jgi:hypothetical protein